MEETVLPVIHIQIEVLDHLLHQVGRGEVDDLVVDIDPRLTESQVCKGRRDVGRDGSGLPVLLDQDRGTARIDGCGLEDVDGRGQQAQDQRNDEPFPVEDAQRPDGFQR